MFPRRRRCQRGDPFWRAGEYFSAGAGNSLMNQPENSHLEWFPGARRRGYWRAGILLLAGLIATTLVARFTQADLDGDARREFAFVGDEIRSKIQDRLGAHEQILNSGAAFLEHAGGVSRQEWRRFAERQRVEQRLPGIQGIGFALLVAREKLAQHVQDIRAEGFPAYEVRPKDARELYSSIIYLEPFTNRNLRAFGYDMLSEPVRRAAMERARDQNTAALSGKVTLVQETEKDVQAGTLMYVAVYRPGMAHETIAQRREALLGWVYSPYRMNDLMRGILGGWDLAGQKRVRLEIFDGDKRSAENLLYDSQSGGERTPGSAARLTIENRVVSAGRQWALRLTRMGGPSSAMGYGKVWLVWFGGASTSLLLSGLLLSLLNTRFKARKMAGELTASLRETQDRLSLLLDDMLEGFAYCQMVFDGQGRPVDFIYLNVNKAFERLTGLRQVVGKPVTEVLPDIKQTNPEVFEIYGRVVLTGNPEKFEIDFKPLGCWLSVSVTQAGPGCFAAIFEDVSARKQAEAALRESEKRFSAFFRSSLVSAAINRVDDGRFIEANDAFLSMFGYRRDEVLGHTSAELGLWPFPEERERLVSRLRDGGCVQQWEGKFRRKSGEVGDVLLSAEFIDLDGQRHMFGMLLDITEQKRAEAEATSLSLRHQVFLQMGSDGIHVLDERGNVVESNHAFCRMLGYSREEMLRLNVKDWDAQWSAEELPGRICQWLGGPGVFETRHRTKDARIREVEINARGVTLESHTYLYASARDITERKQIEAERRQWERQGERLQKAESLNRMAGAIAHHFNNQLQAVMMSLDMAMYGLPDAPGGSGPVGLLAQAKQSALKAAEVSGMMLTYLGHTVAKSEPLDLGEACRSSLTLLRVGLPQNVVIETDLPSPGPTISANTSQIQQVLSNLVTNAWEAVGDGRGSIRLNVKTVAARDIPPAHRFPVDGTLLADAYACLEVADTGGGIPDQDIEKIFDPFFTTKFIGRGMGLAVVLGIVRAYQGAVTVESKPGEGSTFRIFLPLSTESVPRKPVPAARGPETAGDGTVLLVEDDPVVRKVVGHALKQLGIKVLSVVDGVEAVETFPRHRDEIRCVLCDVTMPRMDGWATLAALRQLAPGLPVILASGYNEAHVMAGDHPEWPQAFLSKPYELDDLRHALARVLGTADS